MTKVSNELRYFDALKRIANYTPPDLMQRDNARGHGYGLDADEEIEMAYENVIQEAKIALKGRRRPSSPTRTASHVTDRTE